MCVVTIGTVLSDDDSESVSREASPCAESPRPVSLGSESPIESNMSLINCAPPLRNFTKVKSKQNGKCLCLFYVRKYFDICFVAFLYCLSIRQVTVATQTGHECPDLTFNQEKMTVDKHCYECKVRYRDPKPQDLVMYLHAWKYEVRIENILFRRLLLECYTPQLMQFEKILFFSSAGELFDATFPFLSPRRDKIVRN